MIDETEHKRTIKRAAKRLRATPVMDLVDTKQQEQIDRLIEIDRKHDAQFFIVGAIEAGILAWIAASTFIK